MLIDWIDDHIGLVIFAIIVGVIATLTVAVHHSKEQHDKDVAECTAKHGEWQVVGSHIRTAYVKSGNFLLPIESKVSDWGCSR